MTILDTEYGDLLSMQEAAQLLGVPRTRIKQLTRDNELIVVRRDGQQMVPARLLEVIPAEDMVILQEEAARAKEEFNGTHRPLWNLRGTLTVLRDGGFSSEEIAHWLWTVDDELEVSPIQALENGRHHHVNLVAATKGF